MDADGKINYEVIDGNFPPEQKSIVELIKECEAAHSSEFIRKKFFLFIEINLYIFI